MMRYSEEELQFIKDNVVNPQNILADMFYKKFGRRVTVKAISSLKKRLGIRSGLSGGCKKFTDEQLQFIKDNVVNTEKCLTELVNKKFGTNYTVSSISNIKTKLGIRSGLVGGQFQKGQISHNKGKKWADFMTLEGQSNSRKTTFKKGNTPHNHRPVGSERVNVDGYTEIKVAEPKKWKLKHRVVYEQTKGYIPKSHAIIFADGNMSNFNINNLLCVSREELLVMNKLELIQKYKELTESGLILAKLHIKTNKVKKRIKAYE